jgi:hypothetical protein
MVLQEIGALESEIARHVELVVELLLAEHMPSLATIAARVRDVRQEAALAELTRDWHDGEGEQSG